ncbi:MAG: hypothetical protein F6J93_37045 [Oscillatoria sp. SIO1A7]|nr:hypothetical protein [Oscillatoria sp. SIO1A7]
MSWLQNLGSDRRFVLAAELRERSPICRSLQNSGSDRRFVLAAELRERSPICLGCRT